jgi:hypothetical protein
VLAIPLRCGGTQRGHVRDMKLDVDAGDDDDDYAPRGLFRFHPKLIELERQLFAHVHSMGDLRTLSGYEEVLFCILSDLMDHELALDLSRILVTHAVERVIHDPDRDISSVPHGISRAERAAAFFEVGCRFCEARLSIEASAEPDEDEDCECCSMLVREWRATHADALRQFHRPQS